MSRLFVHVPAASFVEQVPRLLAEHRQAEVACQDARLEQLDFPRLAAAGEQLREAGLRLTLHAPYRDFSPGSRRFRTRERTHRLATESLRLAGLLQAEKIIFHPGIPADGDDRDCTRWLDNSRSFWPEFIEQARSIGTTICLENIYDRTPQWLSRLLEELASPQLRHVFDIGHWNLFGHVGLHDWLTSTAGYLAHLHLHDNCGNTDQHLALGRGNVPFHELFQWLAQKSLTPTLTLENHNRTALQESLQVLQRDYGISP